ncbi:uncharacterized protein LOC144247932 [Lonchura striata]
MGVVCDRPRPHRRRKWAWSNVATPITGNTQRLGGNCMQIRNVGVALVATPPESSPARPRRSEAMESFRGLSDQELLEKLQSRRGPLGPPRKLYEKKFYEFETRRWRRGGADDPDNDRAPPEFGGGREHGNLFWSAPPPPCWITWTACGRGFRWSRS